MLLIYHHTYVHLYVSFLLCFSFFSYVYAYIVLFYIICMYARCMCNYSTRVHFLYLMNIITRKKQGKVRKNYCYSNFLKKVINYRLRKKIFIWFSLILGACDLNLDGLPWGIQRVSKRIQLSRGWSRGKEDNVWTSPTKYHPKWRACHTLYRSFTQQRLRFLLSNILLLLLWFWFNIKK